MSRSQKKNARKKRNKKEKCAELLFEVEEIISGVEQASLQNPCESQSLVDKQVTGSTATSLGTITTAGETKCDDSLKRIRALRKKIKQIVELENRIASGEITNPDQDQLNKIEKKDLFIKELEELMTTQ